MRAAESIILADQFLDQKIFRLKKNKSRSILNIHCCIGAENEMRDRRYLLVSRHVRACVVRHISKATVYF